MFGLGFSGIYVNFLGKFEMRSSTLVSRKKSAVTWKISSFSLNPNSERNELFYKFQSLRCEPWQKMQSNIWDCEEKFGFFFISKYKKYPTGRDFWRTHTNIKINMMKKFVM